MKEKIKRQWEEILTYFIVSLIFVLIFTFLFLAIHDFSGMDDAELCYDLYADNFKFEMYDGGNYCCKTYVDDSQIVKTFCNKVIVNED